MMSDVLLRADDVHTHYGKNEALKGVSIEVRRGEIVALIGANGAGKTTLLMTVCGAPKASGGRILFAGSDITDKPTHEIMQSGIAIAPEGRRVFPVLTVSENLKMGAFFASRAQVGHGLEKVFNLFPRLQERINQRAGTMSGGEQQMLAIGRALMSRPQLLLLDEPSLGLAPLIITQIFKIIEAIRAEGIAVFLVEQNAHKALALADRGYVLENGKIVLSDSGRALLGNDNVRRAYLGA
jgi:branched-chain amino acid transport system ATP-binding protein